MAQRGISKPGFCDVTARIKGSSKADLRDGGRERGASNKRAWEKKGETEVIRWYAQLKEKKKTK